MSLEPFWATYAKTLGPHHQNIILFDDFILFKFKHNKFITNSVNLNIRNLGNDKKK